MPHVGDKGCQESRKTEVVHILEEVMMRFNEDVKITECFDGVHTDKLIGFTQMSIIRAHEQSNWPKKQVKCGDVFNTAIVECTA